jgi:hypothetical protein
MNSTLQPSPPTTASLLVFDDDDVDMLNHEDQGAPQDDAEEFGIMFENNNEDVEEFGMFGNNNENNEGEAYDAENIAALENEGPDGENIEVMNDVENANPNHEDQGAPPLTPRYNLRPRGEPRATFNEAMDAPHDERSYYPPTQLLQQARASAQSRGPSFAFDFILAQLTANVTLNQMTEKAAIRKHGKAAEAALMTEFAQLEDLEVYESLDPASLTRAQRKAALRAINLVKEKRNGTLKGRTCADGRSQRSLYDKSQTASPTVSNDALMLSIIIEAFEGRDVATADVAGAYLKAPMDDFVVMKFVGASVRILCKLNPSHERNVVIENGVEVLYVRLTKALYGCVKSALLWYELFTGTLKKMGFVLNPYDSCVANCMIDGAQCTICWYVDDTKISHVDSKVVTKVIKQLEEHFGTMTVTRGKEHVFLGMNIRYTDEHTAMISMKDYLKEAIAESEMEITRTASTPANKGLFEVNESAQRLGAHDGEVFHSVAAKLLYVSIRARVDLLLAIAFLCTRVSKSTTQDRTKLKRVLEYIKGTMDLEYTIGADHLGRIRTWVDASYAAHPDMRSHTGGAMSLGRGCILCKSTKQKLNTKSSTEAEFVGASDYLPNTIWVKMFLQAQGYDIEENTFEQDNESAIKLERNGRTSAGPKSRHINIRYFWMKDRLKGENIVVRHCPTLQMIGDFFTKPLQGNLFRKFRDVILGYARVDTLALGQHPPVEERVGKDGAKGTGRSGYGTIEPSGDHDSDSTTVTIEEDPDVLREHGGTRQEGGVTWADVLRRTKSAGKPSTIVKEDTKVDKKGRLFRGIILSKQSHE